MPYEKVFPIYPDEAKILKATVYDLSENAARQALFAMVQVLTFKTSITQVQFKEILDDAGKYSVLTKKA